MQPSSMRLFFVNRATYAQVISSESPAWTFSLITRVKQAKTIHDVRVGDRISFLYPDVTDHLLCYIGRGLKGPIELEEERNRETKQGDKIIINGRAFPDSSTLIVETLSENYSPTRKGRLPGGRLILKTLDL
ncbi:MAG: hypothetical protein HY731_11795 [Candidatus Tectomicrobia bacterium]|nr:hypothetical protein [Candidatus Tectomicrobia bacterium]